VSSVSFSNTIGLGSIITAAIVVVAAGVFTLRNNLKSFWKTLAEERGEQVKVLKRS
jgi:Flp pilus assembly pilin Flp